MPMTATQAQQLYVAYFNRPADTLGLAYWMTKDAAAASAAFAASTEYAATYAGMSTAARVDAIYTNLFGRPAEPAGLTYWGGLIESGLISVSNAGGDKQAFVVPPVLTWRDGKRPKTIEDFKLYYVGQQLPRSLDRQHLQIRPDRRNHDRCAGCFGGYGDRCWVGCGWFDVCAHYWCG